MRLFAKIVRFVSRTAFDVFVPDLLKMPWDVCRNFHECFLATDLRERFDLLRLAGQMSPAERDAVVAVVLAAWSTNLPPAAALPAAARQVAAALVDSLVGAAAQPDPAAAMLQSLNRTFPPATHIPAAMPDRNRTLVGST